MTIVLKHSVVAAVGKICTCRCGVTHCCKISKIVQPRVRYFYHVLIIFTWKCILKFPLFYISCEQGNKQREQNWIKIQIYSLRVCGRCRHRFECYVRTASIWGLLKFLAHVDSQKHNRFSRWSENNELEYSSMWIEPSIVHYDIIKWKLN